MAVVEGCYDAFPVNGSRAKNLIEVENRFINVNLYIYFGVYGLAYFVQLQCRFLNTNIITVVDRDSRFGFLEKRCIA